MSTLTDMLKIQGYSEDRALAKKIFKEWLREVSLPDYLSINKDGMAFNSTTSIRQLLIILVDEP